jgi:hypothetical protein
MEGRQCEMSSARTLFAQLIEPAPQKNPRQVKTFHNHSESAVKAQIRIEITRSTGCALDSKSSSRFLLVSI